MVRTENKRELIHSDISEKIIGCCFEVMKELGSGFLEKVYKNALFVYPTCFKIWFLAAPAFSSLQPSASTMCLHMVCFDGCKSETPALPETKF